MKPIDDAEARRLLGPLAGEPGGAQRLDLAEIVRAGDRRRRNRGIRSGVWAGLTLMAIAGGTAVSVHDARQVPAAGFPMPVISTSASAPVLPVPAPALVPAIVGTDCTPAALPGPAVPVSAVDHTGRVTVTEKPSGNGLEASVWKAKTRIARVTLPERKQTRYAVNAAGEFVVTYLDTANKSYAYTGGKLTPLAGGAGEATGIADDGRIVGSLDDGRAVLWAGAGAEPTELPLPGGAVTGGAVGIDQDGTVAGFAKFGSGAMEGLLWMPDGSTRVLSGTGGQYFSSYVNGISNGWVIGSDGHNGGDRLAGFRYNVATDNYETLPAQFGNPQYVGGEGSVIGLGDDGRTYLFVDGDARRLQPVEGSEIGGTPGAQGALGVSDDGRTVTGSAYFMTADSKGATGHGVVWTCG